MRKMIMVLMMVFGLSSVFADSYVAFTSREALALYVIDEEDRAIFNDAVKEEFEYLAKLVGLSEQQRERVSRIIVVNETDVLYEVLVYTEDSKIFGITITDAEGNTIGVYRYEASSKTDPVLVGLNFIKEIVLQVNNIDKNEVVFTAFEVQNQD